MIAIFGIQFWMQYIINSLRSKLPTQLGIARFILFSYYFNDITKYILQMHIDILFSFPTCHFSIIRRLHMKNKYQMELMSTMKRQRKPNHT